MFKNTIRDFFEKKGNIMLMDLFEEIAVTLDQELLKKTEAAKVAQAKEFEDTKQKLNKRKNMLDEKDKEIKQMLEKKDKEMKKEKAALDQRLAEIEKKKQEVDALIDDDAAKTVELGAWEATLNQKAAELKKREQTVAAQNKAFAAKAKELEEREMGVTLREKAEKGEKEANAKEKAAEKDAMGKKKAALARQEKELTEKEEKLKTLEGALTSKAKELEEKEAVVSVRQQEILEQRRSSSSGGWVPLEEFVRGLSDDLTAEGKRVKNIAAVIGKRSEGQFYIKAATLPELTFGVMGPTSGEISAMAKERGSDMKTCMRHLCCEMLKVVRGNHPAGGASSVSSFRA